MKKVPFLLLLALFFSCAEKLIDQPAGLIPKEKMILILNDLAIANAAKLTNPQILRNHNIDPTAYIFEKYDIDSLKFVESDRYYASIPEEHEEIYIAVDAKLEAEKNRLKSEKKERDSIKSAAMTSRKKSKDSLLKSGDKKK
jgi:hypothetical protein